MASWTLKMRVYMHTISFKLISLNLVLVLAEWWCGIFHVYMKVWWWFIIPRCIILHVLNLLVLGCPLSMIGTCVSLPTSKTRSLKAILISVLEFLKQSTKLVLESSMHTSQRRKWSLSTRVFLRLWSCLTTILSTGKSTCSQLHLKTWQRSISISMKYTKSPMMIRKYSVWYLRFITISQMRWFLQLVYLRMNETRENGCTWIWLNRLIWGWFMLALVSRNLNTIDCRHKCCSSIRFNNTLETM